MVSICSGRTLRRLLVLLPLFFAAAAFAQPLADAEVDALLVRLAEKRGGAAMQMDFREVKHLALLAKPVIETGTLSFLPPDKFRREVTGRSLTVCNGEVLWLYYPEFQEAEKYALAANRSLRESLAAMSAGLGLKNLRKDNLVTAARTPAGYDLVLIPRKSALRKTIREIRLQISGTLAVERMEILGADGDRSETAFLNERPAALTPADFEFRPPEGVAVSEPMK